MILSIRPAGRLLRAVQAGATGVLFALALSALPAGAQETGAPPAAVSAPAEAATEPAPAVTAQAEMPAPAEPASAEAAAAPAPSVDKGDVAWMMTSTILVTMMVIPGLALFYGGLVREKNMVATLTQVFTIFCVACLVWVMWGYSLAFGGESYGGIIGGLNRMFLAGIDANSLAATFTAGVYIPEYVFISFQMTFAAITAALIVGGLAERIKFGALLAFAVLWLTFVYAPIAHMVWYADGYLFQLGAFDFAGGTVVHINSGIAALVGAILLGRRIGFGREAMPPHSLTMTMIGASLLWVGWFGFNAGSNLEATGGAGLALINTFVATAAAGLTWQFIEWAVKGKPSLLGLASGVVAGLVAITPACGFAGPMGAIALGAVAAGVAFVFCTAVKNALRYDDSLDVFGIHAVCGIVGALGTAIVADGALGGIKTEDYDMLAQFGVQLQSVLVTGLWTAIGSAALFLLVGAVSAIRVNEDDEREGLDITTHGERAYSH